MASPKRTPVTPDAVRNAKSFLKTKGMLDVFSPKMFAAAAAEAGTGLEETLRFLARLQDGDQGTPFPLTAEAIREEGTAA